MIQWLTVFIGGGLGSMCRFAISKWIPIGSSAFPWATLLANILSCTVLGVVFYYFIQRGNFPENLKILILVGFCGGFSTFSTFSFETLQLIQKGQALLAVAYVVISVLSCLGVFILIRKLLG